MSIQLPPIQTNFESDDTIYKKLEDKGFIIYNQPIASGNCNMIYEGCVKKNNEPIVVKIIYLKKTFFQKALSESYLERFGAEVIEKRKIPHGLTLYQLITHNINFTHRKCCPNKTPSVAFVYKHEGKDLFDTYLQSHDTQLSLEHLSSLSSQFLEFMSHLGDNLSHRDIKAENMFFHNWHAVFGDNESIASVPTTAQMGTYSYFSPESALKISQDKKSDLFSFGITLIICFTYTPLFPKLSDFNGNHIKWRANYLITMYEKFGHLPSDKLLKNSPFLHEIFDVPKEERTLTINDIKPEFRRELKINHWEALVKERLAYFANTPNQDYGDKFLDFLKHILVIDPDKRASINDLLRHPFILKTHHFYIIKPNDGSYNDSFEKYTLLFCKYMYKPETYICKKEIRTLSQRSCMHLPYLENGYTIYLQNIFDNSLYLLIEQLQIGRGCPVILSKKTHS